MIGVYQHMAFYDLCLSLLVLDVKSKDKMPLNSFSHYNIDW